MTLCFHAQQTVEKSLKAILVHRGVEFPKIHSIARLIDLLPADIPRSPELLQSATLTAYAATFRYPAEDDSLDISQAQYGEAVHLAETVYDWAENLLAPAQQA